MLSVERSFSRIFRPWDVSAGNPEQKADIQKNTDTRKLQAEKRESRLRKIRGQFKKVAHQDATVSTTTDCDVTAESHVTNLTLCCDRLLERPASIDEKTPTKDKTKTPETPASLPGGYFPNYIPEYLPTTDIAQALGIPPTDPLFLESLAHGYAMEYEYARILQQENEAKLINARKQRPKKYKCPHCRVGFSNNGQLKGHIRIHTGERPFKCEEKGCGKTFTRNEELTRHKRIHSGLRPFPCATCGKKFGRRDHLKKHTRTHYLQAERMMPVFVPLAAVPQAFPYLYGY